MKQDKHYWSKTHEAIAGLTKKRLILVSTIILVIFIGVYFAFGGQKKTSKANSNSPKIFYVALGDSVAAGQGLPTPTDTSACDRSDESYPNLVAKTLKLELKNIACSGARLTNGILGSQNVNNLNIKSQLIQLDSFQNVGLVTITIGANDVDWLSTISRCYISDCGTATDTNLLATQRDTMKVNLKKVLEALKKQPRVIVSGYYQFMPVTQQSCDSLIGINESKKTWLRNQVDSLNDALQNTVEGFKFANFSKPDFTGHELCSAETWVQSLNDKAPFHPNSAGQDALSRALIATYNTH